MQVEQLMKIRNVENALLWIKIANYGTSPIAKDLLHRNKNNGLKFHVEWKDPGGGH